MKPPQPAMMFKPDDQVFLAFPCYGNEVKAPFLLSLIGLFTQTNVVAKIDVIANDSLVSRARNTHAARFLASKHPHTGKEMQWLLFIDTDIEFAPWHVAQLVRDGIARGGKDIICGMYPLKQTRPHFVCNSIPGQKVDENGQIPVREGGTGFMLIHRSILEKMIEALPEIEFIADRNEIQGIDGEKRWDFFAVGPYFDKVQKVRRYLSEDYYFCQRWRDLGGEVIIDTRIQAKHHGNATFPIPAEEIQAAHDVYTKAAQLLEQKKTQ